MIIVFLQTAVHIAGPSVRPFKRRFARGNKIATKKLHSFIIHIRSSKFCCLLLYIIVSTLPIDIMIKKKENNKNESKKNKDNKFPSHIIPLD